MSAIDKLKSVVPGVETSGPDARTYECQDCGNVLDSAKDPERVYCMECMSEDVEPQ